MEKTNISIILILISGLAHRLPPSCFRSGLTFLCVRETSRAEAREQLDYYSPLFHFQRLWIAPESTPVWKITNRPAAAQAQFKQTAVKIQTLQYPYCC